ncbi:unnamed protein product [Linum trigynum]|uniref:non-specific serine/threonine protein kinase n=1 Tax=Linum trigynum TaxID=586398 RepID=A0AAV2DEZ5_9ROSI
MRKPRRPGIRSSSTLVVPVLFFLLRLASSQSPDADAMMKLKDSLKAGSSLGWSGQNPCTWSGVVCQPSGNRVTRIKISGKGVQGFLPPELSTLTALTSLEVDYNQLTGAVPDLSGLNSIQYLNLMHNGFESIPPAFFSGLTSLSAVYLDNNPLSRWSIPPTLKDSAGLKNFSANNASLQGAVPDFLFSGDSFPGLNHLHLAYNYLQGPLPAASSGSNLVTLWLNSQLSDSKLNGTITVLQNMSSLTQVWLQSNGFTGPIPEFPDGSSLLQDLNLRDNRMTGIVPLSLAKLPLRNLTLTNNLLQGPTPEFPSSIGLDMEPETNRFCLPKPGDACDARINNLLSAVEAFGYPTVFADSWKGNDPCNTWLGIQCSPSGGNITTINFDNKGLTGSISPDFASITSLQNLILSNNDLSGTIPGDLAKLLNLKVLDVSHNNLHGKVPSFNGGVSVRYDGNPDIGKDIGTPPGKTPGGRGGDGSSDDGSGGKNSSTGKIVGSVVGVVSLLGLGGLGFFLYCMKRKRYSKVQSPNTVVIHPRHSGDHDAVKITVAGSRSNALSESNTVTSNGSSEIHVVEAGSLVISIQVLREVTNNFSQDNILGSGGFGTVYKGELPDGTKIAVKRMESAAVGSDKGLTEFTSEIAVLTKVRHRHLVSLLGYCLEGNEKILVYEYMPQGTLSRFLFNWKEEGLQPLEWTRRLTIALDVARAVEYLHGLAHQSFIHRDLKPSNILLGDDLRAKVADFGLVRLAPDGKNSFSTRLAGTFGYMAPEYAVTGRVTIKVDVFSFGVILMELITGRRALDGTEPEERSHLATWFRRMHIDKKAFPQVIDTSIELNDDTLGSINTVADLAGHCTAREPYQRPDMSHVVNTLSSLAELWKPVDNRSGQEDAYETIDCDMTLPQALKKWQEGDQPSISTLRYGSCGSLDNTQTSVTTRPSGFADSFTSADAR